MHIVLYKKSKQSKYYYQIHDRQGHLFAAYSFTVSWWQNSGKSREKHYTFNTRKERDIRLQKILAKKRREGYQVLYHYFKDKTVKDISPILKKMSL